MSKMDRADVSLGKCCITMIQRRPQLASPDEHLACPACNTNVVFCAGRWLRATDSMTSGYVQ
jgi:hypothetical protein